MPYHNYGTMSTTPTTPPLTIPHKTHTTTPPKTQSDLLTPPDSPTSHPLTQHQTALLTLMRRYLALHLRADQARTRMHRQLQQNRYVDVFHGPSYELVRDWQGRLERAGRDYVEAEKWGRRVLAGEERLGKEEGEGGDKWVERVRRRMDELEELLREIG
ncbi:hypothetical protein FB567DRAFT_528803 [Paraphoma chrysanthemicola]|uniref:Uncharacterized protein n=1 Tax=Paraphoma chrysanthemicola TaxID=798071 RepID=A0A8K0R2T6_9PLEO|nr:hypothetical protein FB567DRAFT_528803 [Paraphoma chrysanthemicola]